MSKNTLTSFEQEDARWRSELEKLALTDPTFDFFEAYKPNKPKFEIGQYVRANGFLVPLIETDVEWQEALDDGLAMARSEHEQDYRGYSGLLSSEILERGWLVRHLMWGLRHGDREWEDGLDGHLFEGLRSGALSPTAYMETYVWPREIIYGQQEAGRFGMRTLDGLEFPTASRWRYIPGTNITIFRDPAQDETYHIRLDTDNGYPLSFTISPEYHHVELSYESSGRPIPASDIIEYYEAIRSLPLFDNTQAPVLEMQMDLAGKLHFLQYFKTGHRVDPVDPFFIYPGDNAAITDNVRGATPPEGEEYKLYIAPRRLKRHMRGQGFLIGNIHPGPMGTQLMSRIAGLVVQEWYIGMNGTHFDSSPMYRPKLALGLGKNNKVYTQRAHELLQVVYGIHLGSPGVEANVYVDVHVTSNGEFAVLDTDWEPHFEEW